MGNNTLFKDAEIAGERKRSKRGSNPVFKEYNQSRSMLLPPSVEELIPENHYGKGGKQDDRAVQHRAPGGDI